jgi:Tol biopolymer transport system component/Zn-dependent M28 family amino/carboxypeptidase
MIPAVKRTPVIVALAVAACGPATSSKPAPEIGRSLIEPDTLSLAHPQEVQLQNIRQLTRGVGENAEAYWSFDGAQLIFQSKRDPYECDQIFSVSAGGAGEPRLVSTGRGRTTCAYFQLGDKRVLWASTHLAGDACPPEPDRSEGYVWPIYDTYDIFSSLPDGSDVRQLTKEPGYDAEATVCARDGSIVFTSTRDGDLELYRMDADGSNVKRLTHTPGYDGGGFFSADCSKIVWRASRPTGPALADYQRLLKKGLVRPGQLEIFVANADGTDARQITYLNAGSFAPFFFPSGRRILFSSNYGDPKGREFDMWAVNVDGTALEQITYAPRFDGFPMFSPDGRALVFASNRNQARPGETDVFVATWVDREPVVARESPADRFMADVRWLADDARAGRGVGSTGAADSARWLIEQFRSIGLEPGLGDSYQQSFEVAVDVERRSGTVLSIDGKKAADELFVPSSASASATVRGATVVAGYGISAPELGLDDYKRVAAKGKVVIVRRFVPDSPKLQNTELQQRYSDLRYKAWNAREHGATALVVVDVPAGNKPAEEAPLPALTVDRHGDAGIPVVVVKRELGKALLRGRHQIELAVELDQKMAPATNIVGVLRAQGDQRLPGAVVIGAHYDHLGMGQEGSLAPDVAAPHNGADDNASGVAALLEAARVLARTKLRRDVYVVGFSGEETGILGSTAFTRTPPPGLDMSAVVAMVNMDMVGRMRNNQLQVLGAESAAQWAELVSPACAELRIQCQLGGDGYGPSDQTPFYAAGVPVLHLFTGAHTDYHKPSDDWEHINGAGGAQIAHLAAEVVLRLTGRGERLTYKAAPAPVKGGDLRSHGASLGTIPDYAGAADGAPGVLLAGVRAGGPAAKAGLRRGDRLIKIGSHDVANIRDMMFVLRKLRPGDTSSVVVVRDGAKVTTQVTFGQSSRTR